jgi:hypothetical protein
LTITIPILQIRLDFHTREFIEGIVADFDSADGDADRSKRHMAESSGSGYISHPLFSHLGLIGPQWVRQVGTGVVDRLPPQMSLTLPNLPKKSVQFALPLSPGYQSLDVPE